MHINIFKKYETRRISINKGFFSKQWQKLGSAILQWDIKKGCKQVVFSFNQNHLLIIFFWLTTDKLFECVWSFCEVDA